MKLLFKTMVFSCLLSLFACGNGSNHNKKILSEWIGKKIEFPTGIKCIAKGHDTAYIQTTAPYKILVYVDSTGCTDCKAQLLEWKDLIEEVDSTVNMKLDFLFYFQPKEKKDLLFLLERNMFEYPVYVDSKGTLNSINKFPKDPLFRTLLLDSNDYVLAIGNPIINQSIWKLYKKIITNTNN